MKIAIIHHSAFDRVRRGTERYAHELAKYLVAQGHEVTMISCKPGPRERKMVDGYLSDSRRRLWFPLLGKLGILESHCFLPQAFWILLREKYDVIQCCSFLDAFAARLARRFTRVPYAIFVNAIPPPVNYFRTVTLGGRVFHRAVADSDEVISISRYVQNYCSNRFGRGGVQLPVPVDNKLFHLQENRNHDTPHILCMAAMDDKRKGGRVLMLAFNLVKQKRPEVNLKLCCDVEIEVVEDLLLLVEPQWRSDVEFLGAGAPSDLPDIYAAAAVTVLPSLWEAFGMVVIESMATGTPVVGTRDGALPETISDPQVGCLFAPGENAVVEPNNVEGLAQALLDCLELSKQPGTAAACARHAEQYSWDVVGPKYEAVYKRLASQQNIETD